MHLDAGLVHKGIVCRVERCPFPPSTPICSYVSRDFFPRLFEMNREVPVRYSPNVLVKQIDPKKKKKKCQPLSCMNTRGVPACHGCSGIPHVFHHVLLLPSFCTFCEKTERSVPSWPPHCRRRRKISHRYAKVLM